MALEREEFLRLEQKARDLRKLIIDTVVWAGSGHVGGALSSIDIMTILYHKFMNIDPENPGMEDRDRFILSKGHIGVGLAPVLADKGYFPKTWLETYNHTGSDLGMHLDKNKIPGLDASTGSLGHGLPLSLGLGLSARVKGQNFRTYCLMGDGECDEGSVWEAAMSAGKRGLDNLVAMVDYNKYQSYGETSSVQELEPFAAKWEAFGFNCIEVNGHDVAALRKALDPVSAVAGKPTAIICHTIKGKGIDFAENNLAWHHKSNLPTDDIAALRKCLEG